ncbi:MAG: sulfatase [Clostridia bacterium]|nr:sulfatase [Clostridia bacterium]
MRLSISIISIKTDLSPLGFVIIFVIKDGRQVLEHKPNFLFILADDLGWMDLSCTGSTFYETPNIDNLALEGMRFTNAYAACPVCSPTRASIMTGKYPASIGLTNFVGGNARGYLVDAPYADHISVNEKTFADELKDNGYRTWHVGKWHLAGRYDRTEEFKTSHYPDKHGFDVNIAGCEAGMPHHGYFAPWMIKNLSEGEKGEYLPDRLTDEAIRLVRNNDGRPFFLNLWYYLVHIPIEAKKEDIEYFIKKKRDLSLDKVVEFETGDFFPCEHKMNERIIRRLVQSDPVYAAMLKSLDKNIGRVMEALKETGQYDDTVVFFTSDNGGLSTAEGSPTCNKPLNEGKGWMYEGGVREPLIIKWKDKIKPGSICHEIVTSPDFYPTILEMAHVNTSKNVDGLSLLDLVSNDKKLAREAVFWHYPHYANQGGTPGSSVRMGNYKLIQFYEYDRCELYNLEDDPGESIDLFDIRKDIAGRMMILLEEWKKSVEGMVPERNPSFVPWSKCHSELI